MRGDRREVPVSLALGPHRKGEHATKGEHPQKEVRQESKRKAQGLANDRHKRRRSGGGVWEQQADLIALSQVDTEG